MIEKLLDVEGPVMRFFDKTGQLITLSFLWLLGCLPIVTVATSTTALYYASMKVVRRDRGTAAQEFWRSYKANLGRGIPVTVLMGAVMGLLLLNIQILQNQPNQTLLSACTVAGLAVLGGVSMYICPVLSRFTMKMTSALMLSFVMAVRFLHYTLLLLAGTALMIGLQIWVLPMPTVLILPGLWSWATTFLTEKALRRYMPEQEADCDEWYYA